MKLAQVPPDLIEPMWPMIGSHLEKAIAFSGGADTVEATVGDIMAKRKQLWVAGEEGAPITAVAVTKLQQYPSGLKEASILHIGGDDGSLKDLLDLRAELEAWAKVEGCTRVRIYGRLGWARRLPDYKLKIYVLSKDI